MSNKLDLTFFKWMSEPGGSAKITISLELEGDSAVAAALTGFSLAERVIEEAHKKEWSLSPQYNPAGLDDDADVRVVSAVVQRISTTKGKEWRQLDFYGPVGIHKRLSVFINNRHQEDWFCQVLGLKSLDQVPVSIKGKSPGPVQREYDGTGLEQYEFTPMEAVFVPKRNKDGELDYYNTTDADGNPVQRIQPIFKGFRGVDYPFDERGQLISVTKPEPVQKQPTIQKKKEPAKKKKPEKKRSTTQSAGRKNGTEPVNTPDWEVKVRNSGKEIIQALLDSVHAAVLDNDPDEDLESLQELLNEAWLSETMKAWGFKGISGHPDDRVAVALLLRQFSKPSLDAKPPKVMLPAVEEARKSMVYPTGKRS